MCPAHIASSARGPAPHHAIAAEREEGGLDGRVCQALHSPTAQATRPLVAGASVAGQLSGSARVPHKHVAWWKHICLKLNLAPGWHTADRGELPRLSPRRHALPSCASQPTASPVASSALKTVASSCEKQQLERCACCVTPSYVQTACALPTSHRRTFESMPEERR